MFYRRAACPSEFSALGFVVHPVGDSDVYVGCVRQGILTADAVTHFGRGLAFGIIQATAETSRGPVGRLLRILGEHLAPLRWIIPSCPSAHALEVAQSAADIAPQLIRPMGGAATTIATDARSKIPNSTCADQWESEESRRVAQEAIVVDDDHSALDPTSRGPAAMVRIVNFPTSMNTSNKAEVFTFTARVHFLL